MSSIPSCASPASIRRGQRRSPGAPAGGVELRERDRGPG